MRKALFRPILLGLFTLHGALAAWPGARVLLDAHNAYPYAGRWLDRIDRALATGLPIAIEQDLYWFQDPATGRAWSVVAHGKPVTGAEPTLREHFFEKIRPMVERALTEDRRDRWPLFVLNLDFKTNEPEHHEAIWRLLGEYEAWLTTAERTAEITPRQPLDWKPVLVLTGADPRQRTTFYDRVPVGGRLRLFGAVAAPPKADARTPLKAMAARPADNYVRWWNNPWSVVETGGPPRAGEWTAGDRGRLRRLVRHAHRLGYWIRFYTLNGYATPQAGAQAGAGRGYDFGSPEAVRLRWGAAIEDGVDFVATDQYEEFAAELRRAAGKRRPPK